MKAFFVWTTLLFSSLLCASECTYSGQSAAWGGWSSQIKRVCLTDAIVANSFRSPDQDKLILADASGFHLKVRGKSIEWPGGKELMTRGAEVSWSPTSLAFFINDGDGSGLDGWTLNVYSILDDRVINHDEINQQIVHRFRTELGCPQKAVNPNVRGLGWSKGGDHIFAFAQSTVSESCGQQGDFRGMLIDLAGGTIQGFYSEADAN